MPTMLLDRPPMVRRNDASAKLDAEIVANAKIIAACRGIPVAEYLSGLLKDLVSRDLEVELKRRLKAGQSLPRKPKGGEQ